MQIQILIAILIILLMLVITYLYYENNVLKVTKYKLVKSNLPRDFNNYKIIQISDFHNEKSQILTKKLVQTIIKEKPDIIVITGDFADFYNTDINVAINFAKQIVNIAPIYYVTGNHEARIQIFPEFERSLKELGINIIDNKAVTIAKGTSTLEILGIKDPWFRHKEDIPDKQIAKQEIESTKYNINNFTILLSHRPELFETYVEEKIDVVFTGHAHGGQVRLPFIGGLYAPNQGSFPKYTKGVFEKENTSMVISRGIGNSSFPYRVNNRPELVVTTLTI